MTSPQPFPIVPGSPETSKRCPRPTASVIRHPIRRRCITGLHFMTTSASSTATGLVPTIAGSSYCRPCLTMPPPFATPSPKRSLMLMMQQIRSRGVRCSSLWCPRPRRSMQLVPRQSSPMLCLRTNLVLSAIAPLVPTPDLIATINTAAVGRPIVNRCTLPRIARLVNNVLITATGTPTTAPMGRSVLKPCLAPLRLSMMSTTLPY